MGYYMSQLSTLILSKKNILRGQIAPFFCHFLIENATQLHLLTLLQERDRGAERQLRVGLG